MMVLSSSCLCKVPPEIPLTARFCLPRWSSRILRSRAILMTGSSPGSLMYAARRLLLDPAPSVPRLGTEDDITEEERPRAASV